MASFIEFPIFTGVSGDLRPWISWLENFFVREKFTADEKLNLAQSLLEGEAEVWFYRNQKMLPFQSWEDLKANLWLMFGDFAYLDRIRRNPVNRCRKTTSLHTIESFSATEPIEKAVCSSAKDESITQTQIAAISGEKKELKKEVDLSLEKIASPLTLPNTKVHVSDSENLRNIEPRTENSVLDYFGTVVKKAKIQQNIRMDVVNGDVERIQRVLSITKNVSAHQVLDKTSAHKDRLKQRRKRMDTTSLNLQESISNQQKIVEEFPENVAENAVSRESSSAQDLIEKDESHEATLIQVEGDTTMFQISDSLEEESITQHQVPISSLEPRLSFSSEPLDVSASWPCAIVSNNPVHSQSVLDCVTSKTNAYQVFDKTSSYTESLKPKTKRKLRLSLKTWMFKFKHTSKKRKSLDVQFFSVEEIVAGCEKKLFDRFPTSPSYALDVVNKTSKPWETHTPFTSTPVASVNSLSFAVDNFELCVGHDRNIMRLKLRLHSGCDGEKLPELNFHFGVNHGLLVFPWNLWPLEFFWFFHLEDKVCLSGASNSWCGWLVFDRGKSNIITGEVITLVSIKEFWIEIMDGDIAKLLNSTCGKLQSYDYGLEITFLRRLRVHQQQQKRKFIKSWRFKYKSSLRNNRSESRELKQFVGFVKFQLKHKWRSKHLHTISALGFYLSSVFSTVTSANFGRLQGLLEQVVQRDDEAYTKILDKLQLNLKQGLDVHGASGLRLFLRQQTFSSIWHRWRRKDWDLEVQLRKRDLMVAYSLRLPPGSTTHDSSENSWMFSNGFVCLFPTFKLEDKLVLQGESIDTITNRIIGRRIRT